MRVVAYTALHYGLDYLGWAIRSVIDQVDEYIVLYSAQGSHGHSTDRPCPESRLDLQRVAFSAAGKKLKWYDGIWVHEGQQRDTILTVARDADAIIVLDSDEIWPDGLVTEALSNVAAGMVRIPMIHYWRSFYRAVLHDPAYPIRVLFPSRVGEITLDTPLRISHFGYAQNSVTVEYKQHVHGHKNEWRRDWYTDKFMANAQQDCHPVGSEYWNPEPINPGNYLPGWMIDHPYAHLEMIP